MSKTKSIQKKETKEIKETKEEKQEIKDPISQLDSELDTLLETYTHIDHFYQIHDLTEWEILTRQQTYNAITEAAFTSNKSRFQSLQSSQQSSSKQNDNYDIEDVPVKQSNHLSMRSSIKRNTSQSKAKQSSESLKQQAVEGATLNPQDIINQSFSCFQKLLIIL